jgi:hypothetical protein
MIYPITGEPLSFGVVHYITAFGPSILVEGAAGVSGT